MEDSDNSQNCGIGRKTRIEKLKIEIFSILPARSDLNSIENIFHLIEIKLEQNMLENNLIRENFEGFVIPEKIMMALNIDAVNEMTESLINQFKDIIKRKSGRLKRQNCKYILSEEIVVFYEYYY